MKPVAMATVAASSYSYMEGAMGLKVCLEETPELYRDLGQPYL